MVYHHKCYSESLLTDNGVCTVCISMYLSVVVFVVVLHVCGILRMRISCGEIFVGD